MTQNFLVTHSSRAELSSRRKINSGCQLPISEYFRPISEILISAFSFPISVRYRRLIFPILSVRYRKRLSLDIDTISEVDVYDSISNQALDIRIVVFSNLGCNGNIKLSFNSQITNLKIKSYRNKARTS